MIFADLDLLKILLTLLQNPISINMQKLFSFFSCKLQLIVFQFGVASAKNLKTLIS